jgi:hexosaminidase
VTLDADGALGVLRGLATLRQLIEVNPPGAALPLVAIDDAPRFAWRGVMIDTARHFMTLETVKRQIDAMERVKLNVLHMHLSDDQGFRVESKRYPKLQTTGDGQHYTQASGARAGGLRRRARRARSFRNSTCRVTPARSPRPIRIRPGAAEAGQRLRRPDRALDPTKEETYRFLDGLFAEMGGLFPDAYFHAGGDEVSDAVWLDHPRVQAFMQAKGTGLQASAGRLFPRRVAQILKKHGKTMIGWEEVAATGAVPKDVVIQAWQTSNATAASVAKGHRTIVSAGYYLDLLNPASFHYAFDPLDTSAAGLTPAEAEKGRKLSPIMAAVLTDALVAKPLPPADA